MRKLLLILLMCNLLNVHAQNKGIKESPKTVKPIATVNEYKALGVSIYKANFQEVIKYVASGKSLDRPSDFEYNVLSVAVQKNAKFDPALLKYLIDNGADVNQINGDESNTTALSFAIRKTDNCFEKVKILLDAGASPNYREKSDGSWDFNGSLLEKAIVLNVDDNIILAMINANADLKKTFRADNINLTTLGLALVMNYSSTVIKALIDKGSNVNARIYNDSESCNILNWAEYCNVDPMILALLKSKGAKKSSTGFSDRKSISINGVINLFSSSLPSSSPDVTSNEPSKQAIQNKVPSEAKKIEFREDRVSKCTQGYIRIFKVYKNGQYHSSINVGVLGDGKWYRDCPKGNVGPQTTVLQSKVTLKGFLIDCYSVDDGKADSYTLKTLNP